MDVDVKVLHWVQAVAGIASTVGLIVAAFNLWNVVRGIRSQTYQRVYETMIGLDRFFAENAGVKQYVFGQVPEDEVIDSAKVIPDKNINLFSVAEMMIDYFDNVYYQRGSMPPGTFDAFSEYMRETVADSRLLRAFLREKGHIYPDKFIEHLRLAPEWLPERWPEEKKKRISGGKR